MRYNAGIVPTTEMPPRIAWMEYGSRLVRESQYGSDDSTWL